MTREELRNAGEFASMPGVTVKEVRERLGLEPLGDPNIDNLVLNLPLETPLRERIRSLFRKARRW